MKCGVLIRLGSFWIGAHWSGANRRLCVNLVPCVTFWIGTPPAPEHQPWCASRAWDGNQRCNCRP